MNKKRKGLLYIGMLVILLLSCLHSCNGQAANLTDDTYRPSSERIKMEKMIQ